MPGTQNAAPRNPDQDASAEVDTDEQLMSDFSRGAPGAFDELFSRYKQPIFGFFRRRVLDPAHATVDVQLNEEFKARLDSPDDAVATRMQNAFVAGYRNASRTILGIVLFCEEYGPAILIWLAILGTPILLLRRRYRRAKSRL